MSIEITRRWAPLTVPAPARHPPQVMEYELDPRQTHPGSLEMA